MKVPLLQCKTIDFTVQKRLFWIARTALLQSEKMIIERKI
ncbi:hypothetical protein PI172_0481 [Prevotella intermedia]|uniref:Uncharacterized protein n=1 Tax=Prevotella intermedia TaxID=28131 RepID=A0AAD1F6I9_PREIN|nr:hypothetical protein PI172_0481 [Prevotella intermedia]